MNNINISKQTKLGWIGTGVMGRWMCQHCLEAGFSTTVYNRTSSKAKPLIDLGAKLATSPREVAKQSDVVISMVGYPSDVREVILGQDGVLAGLAPGGIIIDMTTSEPSLALDIAQNARAKHCYSIDAPVSGGDIGAKQATLSIMAGGDEAIFQALTPLWQAMAKSYTYMGKAGSGQHTKMVNQIAISSGMIALVEALLYAQRAGLAGESVLQAIGGGAAGSWSLTNYGPRILRRDFAPGFYVDHFVKDLEIALHEARKMNLSLPGLSLAHKLYVNLQALGQGRSGTQALMLALEEMNKQT